jgi:DnaK suppressor protein
MIENQIVAELRDRLVEERKIRIINHQRVDASWHRLQAPEPESAETADKAHIAQEIEQREKMELAEIGAIEAALAKISTGKFGDCEACGNAIATKRLQALPWARYCAECAHMREEISVEEPAEVPVSFETTGLTDPEMCQAIWDELNSEDRVDTEELVISCRNGVIILDGYLPGRKEHSILLGIIQDMLDFNEIMDNIRIDRQLWERRDRQSGRKRKSSEAENDVYDTLENNQPLTPPEVFIPENQE